MHCQLKQTAFFVADSARKPNRYTRRREGNYEPHERLIYNQSIRLSETMDEHDIRFEDAPPAVAPEMQYRGEMP